MSYEIKYDGFAEFPSFQYVGVQISNAQNEHYIPQKGKIDTGAYMTVIPEYMVKLLNLKSPTIEEAGGFDSDVREHDAYFVNVKIDDLVYPYVKVITQSDKRRQNVLVGRNLLNLWHMKLNGETHKGEFTSFSQNPIDAT